MRRLSAYYTVFILLSSAFLGLSGCWLTDSIQDNTSILIIGSWVQKGDVVNRSPIQDASAPKITLRGLTPYVAWIENSADGVAQIYVAHWDGTAWISDGGSLNSDVTKAVTEPLDIASDGTSVYVGWTETGLGAHVKKLIVSTGQWTELGTGASILSPEENGPRLSSSRGFAFSGGTLYAILTESGIVRVKHYNSSASRWDQDLPDLNASGGSTPTLALLGTTLYAAWIEGGSLWVDKRSGSFWVEADSGLPVSGASDPILVVSGGTLYSGWTESGTTHVADWDGAVWSEIPDGPNISSAASSSALRIADWSGDLATVFLAPTSQSANLVHSSLLIPEDPTISTANTWIELGNGLFVDNTQAAASPAIASSSLTNPWVAWIEPAANGFDKLIVDHWE